jgi:hypothetical protein
LKGRRVPSWNSRSQSGRERQSPNPRIATKLKAQRHRTHRRRRLTLMLLRPRPSPYTSHASPLILLLDSSHQIQLLRARFFYSSTSETHYDRLFNDPDGSRSRSRVSHPVHGTFGGILFPFRYILRTTHVLLPITYMIFISRHSVYSTTVIMARGGRPSTAGEHAGTRILVDWVS